MATRDPAARFLLGLCAVVTIVLMVVFLQPQSPQFLITSASVTQPELMINEPHPPADIHLTLSVPSLKYKHLHAVLGYVSSKLWDPSDVLLESSFLPFRQHDGDRTTIDVRLEGYVDPELAAAIKRESANVFSLVNNTAVAVCRDVHFAKTTGYDEPVEMGLPVKCYNLQ